MFLSISVVVRLGIIAAFIWVVTKCPTTHGGHLLSFIAGMSLLSLVSDERIKKWFVLPDLPSQIKVPNHDGTAPDMVCHVGLPEQFEEHFADILDEECILMAANRHSGTGQIWAVERPGRHSHVMWAMETLSVPEHTRVAQQGFLTSYGRYVDRKEAALIASSANQLLDKQHTPPILFSEDVWATPPWPGMDKQEGAGA